MCERSSASVGAASGRGVGVTVELAGPWPPPSRRRRGAPAPVRADPAVHLRRAVLPDAGDGLRRRCATCCPARRRRRRAWSIPAGELARATSLAASGEPPPGEALFLRYVQAPLNPIELARFNEPPRAAALPGPGRLARVGLLARMLDAGLVASLLVRGKVPGGTAAAAAVKYEAQRAADPRVSYHGRVVRRDGWVVLQYLFFYAMNDWRSTFEGANDHEADWEQAFVILEETPDGGVSRSGSRRPRTTRRARTCAGAGTTRGSSATASTSWSTRGPARMRRTSSRASTSCGSACPGATSSGPSWTTSASFWRDTLRQPDPGDLAETLARAAQRPVRRLRARRRVPSGRGRRSSGRRS